MRSAAVTLLIFGSLGAVVGAAIELPNCIPFPGHFGALILYLGSHFLVGAAGGIVVGMLVLPIISFINRSK